MKLNTVQQASSNDNTATEELFWSFGFGSNMNVEQVQTKKGLKVGAHVCASLSGWKIAFTMGGLEYVEPSFADAKKTGDDRDEIHGVALALSAKDMAKLDSQVFGGFIPWNQELLLPLWHMS
jgi:hypothetical protein